MRSKMKLWRCIFTERVVITVHEVAEMLQISLPTAYALVKSPGFPVINLGRKKLIPKAEFNAWLADEARRGARGA